MRTVADPEPGNRTRIEGALFGAAVGDALGWPIEGPSRRVGGTARVQPRLAFAEWTRREGGAWAAHEEEIAPGSYSDDTQLILSLTRSLAREDWYQHLTRFELPFWLMYQRGGGGGGNPNTHP
jgi:ADP-ribosylglycohydrolase